MFKKVTLSVNQVAYLEAKLNQSILNDIPFNVDDTELAQKFNLEVKYVDDDAMPDGVEAQLTPPASVGYNGLICVRKTLSPRPFAFTHEIIHYVFDVGIGHAVVQTYARFGKGKQKSSHEQDIDYMTAAFRMPYTQLVKDIQRYDAASPRMNAVVFVNSLCKKYNADRDSVVRRVQEVRKYSACKK